MRRALPRIVLALLAGMGLVLAGPAASHATSWDSAPANQPGGVDETVEFGRTTVVPQPYTPDPTAAFGDHQCQLRYHEYYPTPGCGGFTVDVTLHNVRNQPGYIAGNYGGDSSVKFTAKADTARTFGCRTPAGEFDWDTAFVVRTTQSELDRVYFEADAGYIVDQFRQDKGRDYGPHFYMNFPAVKVDCAEGSTPVQYGLKVTNLSISITGSDVFGTTSWHHDGPFYG